MTGVDILESDGKTFKDIYTIVSGIADKWSSLQDIDRAALLEALAGKNQSNALAAALSQPEILKKEEFLEWRKKILENYEQSKNELFGYNKEQD